jgi:O-methyltransferase
MGAETMIGLRRLENLEECIVDVIRGGIPGDLLEAGVWRGGATILMRAVLKAYGATDRVVWVADSFQGLPKPDPDHYPADAGDRHWTWPQLSVSEAEVRRNFARYGLLDDQVRFLAGWFRDTLPNAPVDRLAILRIDADMYESTREALTYLYPKLSPGGYVIIDDYGDVAGCRKAVDDFRAENAIAQELRKIDTAGVFWQRVEDPAMPLPSG